MKILNCLYFKIDFYFILMTDFSSKFKTVGRENFNLV